MDQKGEKALRIVLYISIATAFIFAVVAGLLFKGLAIIGIFFGIILGFFLPWVVALIGYSIYMMSNPVAAFKDEIEKLDKS